jgi:catechol 2,3-dioxygenase-like lactoylglutathione lyase family enzyme
MSATATATAVRLQVSLNVTDLDRSVRFYRPLLATEPALHGSQQVRFELADPPVTLALTPVAKVAGGAINHVGLRLPDSAALVEVQRRLEEAGVATQRQEGVECCYSRQTKFWATDPDGNLWELYILEEDIDHSGFEDAPRPVAPAVEPTVWSHMLTQPVPERIPAADASLDEVRLEGTFNGRREDWQPTAFFAEVFRVLRPGGKVLTHGLAANAALEAPKLPGLAALVRRVPALAETLELLRGAGFAGLYFEKLGPVACLQADGVEFREFALVGRRPEESTANVERRVLYKGPLAEVNDEDGTVYPRGRAVVVGEQAWQRLQAGPAAGQFLFFPVESR